MDTDPDKRKLKLKKVEIQKKKKNYQNIMIIERSGFAKLRSWKGLGDCQIDSKVDQNSDPSQNREVVAAGFKRTFNFITTTVQYIYRNSWKTKKALRSRERSASDASLFWNWKLSSIRPPRKRSKFKQAKDACTEYKLCNAGLLRRLSKVCLSLEVDWTPTIKMN